MCTFMKAQLLSWSPGHQLILIRTACNSSSAGISSAYAKAAQCSHCEISPYAGTQRQDVSPSLNLGLIMPCIMPQVVSRNIYVMMTVGLMPTAASSFFE